MYVEEQRKAQM
jgi:hypothetical protein